MIRSVCAVGCKGKTAFGSEPLVSLCAMDDGSTLVGGDEGDILGSRRHAEYLVAVDLSLHLRQVAKGTGDAHRKVRNVAHLHQQLYER